MQSVLNKYVLGAFFTLLLFSCKKEELPDIQENDPVFHMQYAVDGESRELNAGDDGWELQTGKSDFMGFESSYGQFYNTESGAYFRMDYFFSGLNSLSDNYDNLSSPLPLFSMPEEVVEKFLFEGDFENVQSVLWSVNGSGFTPVNLEAIKEPGTYEICLQVLFSEGCTRTLCNTFYLGVPNQIHARYEVQQSNLYQKTCEAQIRGDFDEVKWYVNDDYYASGSTIALDSLNQGFHELSMRVFKDGQMLSQWNELITFGNVLCRFNCFDIVSSLQEELIKGVVFTYFTQEGKYYTSSLAEQSGQIVVADMELYDELNENGQQVLKMKLQGDLNLAGENGEQITLQAIQTTIGIAL